MYVTQQTILFCMKPPSTIEPPPQSLTLSLRISEVLRKRLEDIRRLATQKKGGNVSTSEIAKQLLESAREDRLEVVDLLAKATESLLTVRRKGESGQPLSRAEWTVLAYYVQQGAEGYSKNALSRDSYITIVKAFQAVYELRVGKSEKDDYYLGNLPAQCRPEGHKVSDPVTPDLVRQTVTETLRCASSPAIQCTPVHAARNLYVFLEDEKLPGVTRINEALFPYWRVLWRVAARGHYLERKEPVREGLREQDNSIYRPALPSIEQGGYRLSFARGRGNAVSLLLSFPAVRDAMYPMGPYPMISEFRAMLARLPQIEFPDVWDGEHFLGYPADIEGRRELWFRSQKNGIAFGFSLEEWKTVQEVFRKAWEDPELKRAWEGLSLEYGEL